MRSLTFANQPAALPEQTQVETSPSKAATSKSEMLFPTAFLDLHHTHFTLPLLSISSRFVDKLLFSFVIFRILCVPLLASSIFSQRSGSSFAA